LKSSKQKHPLTCHRNLPAPLVRQTFQRTWTA
jgi:hypothetical protein